MKQNTTKIVLAETDFELMTAYLKGVKYNGSYDRTNIEELHAELKRATIVKNAVFPRDAVRLNSTVILKDESAGKVLQVTVVTPEKADIKQRRISFMAPIGTALIGFREGERVKWNVPSGKKVFMILKVMND